MDGPHLESSKPEALGDSLFSNGRPGNRQIKTLQQTKRKIHTTNVSCIKDILMSNLFLTLS